MADSNRREENGFSLKTDSRLIGNDLRSVPAAFRTLFWYDIAGLWVGMVVCVPSYYMAGSLIDLGMSWWQGIATIVCGNTIILIPLILNGHPGARYGISFPILLRSAFGIQGAYVPALFRALVACGWCGIETWIGGQAIFLLLLPSSLKLSWYAQPLSWLGISVLEFCCFLLFLLVQLGILWKGMDRIKSLEKYSAPVLILMVACLFFWAYCKAGGFGEMLSTPSRLNPNQFWPVFLSSLTASITTWSGLGLNISDFTRFANSQFDQIVGQLGMPIFMGLFTFSGLAITSSTAVIYGRVISNPVELFGEIGGSTLTVVIAILGISLATITTNIPANFVAPANALVSFSPSTFSFLGAAALTGLFSMAFQPWKIIQSSENFIYTWLVGSSIILSPIMGIMLTDYYIIRRMVLDVNALYSDSTQGPYYYVGGYNIAAFSTLIICVAPTVPGLLHKTGIIASTSEAFLAIYDNAWFFGIFSASIIYWLLSQGRRNSKACVDPSMLESLQPTTSIL
ncbi:purine-uracil permease NCS1-like [Typha latifolia]|uniref:purine-uracil permease NCS1-like n=1 Tax=Typha latifolia TaxID=4733 RepID=UPI003C2D2EC2